MVVPGGFVNEEQVPVTNDKQHTAKSVEKAEENSNFSWKDKNYLSDFVSLKAEWRVHRCFDFSIFHFFFLRIQPFLKATFSRPVIEDIRDLTKNYSISYGYLYFIGRNIAWVTPTP